MTLSQKWDFGLYAYMFDKWEGWTCPFDLKDDMWHLFGFVFGKVRVNEWPLSWKLYFSLYGYKFDKWEGWTCPLIKYDMCNYFLLNSVNWKSWNDSWRENEILA